MIEDVKDIHMYAVDHTKILPVFPGTLDREWINNIEGTPFYFDLTMTMASRSGWEFRAPEKFEIEWNGGPKTDDLLVRSYIKEAPLFYTGLGHGICTIKTGYVIKTPPEYAVFITQAPSFFKDNASQISALYETNWSYIPVILNWKLKEPGVVKFERGEPLGFMTIIPHAQMDSFDLKIESLFDNVELYKQYQAWADEKAITDPYVEGIINPVTGEKTTGFHITDRKLKKPKNMITFTSFKKDDNIPSK